jgi:tetratricopeptide (TPR) repeat protein
MKRKSVATTASLIVLGLLLCPLAKAQMFSHKNKSEAKYSDWQTEEQMAMACEQQGDFPAAEKNFLKARKDLLKEFRTAPPSSFNARWFPLQDALRNLYLHRASSKEGSLSFGEINGYYKKALQIPGANYEVWEQYADFLKRKGKTKEAEQALKEGKKKGIYQDNRDQ